MSKVLITGCSKGLGREVALELARRGHEVVATARKPETLADLPVAQRLALDVTSDESVRGAVDAAGPIDVLVNNAAEIVYAPVETIPLEQARKLFEINYFGMLRMVQAFVPGMRERRSGAVVNLSSVVGRVTLPLIGIYSSTKWAIESVSEALRLELAGFGVRVAIVEPGTIATGALDAPPFLVGPAYAALAESQGPPPRESMSAPSLIASVVADAVEGKDARFRYVAGADATQLLAARAQLTDEAFYPMLQQVLHLDNWFARGAL